MTTDTITRPDYDKMSVEELGAEAERRLTHRKQEREARRPGYDLEEVVSEAAKKLQALADSANMRTAHNTRMRAEEASAFLGYLSELSSVCDDMFRKAIRLAGDNVGVFSPAEQDELAKSRIVSDALHNDWTAYFKEWAESAGRRPASYASEYHEAIREMEERTR